ncbi:hypothetical protein DEH18_34580 [Streptomyces sp. NHF165]|nr:hypothetical protein DEH18_34580 [Streptomyces sp. NHF165]
MLEAVWLQVPDGQVRPLPAVGLVTREVERLQRALGPPLLEVMEAAPQLDEDVAEERVLALGAEVEASDV